MSVLERFPYYKGVCLREVSVSERCLSQRGFRITKVSVLERFPYQKGSALERFPYQKGFRIRKAGQEKRIFFLGAQPGDNNFLQTNGVFLC